MGTIEHITRTDENVGTVASPPKAETGLEEAADPVARPTPAPGPRPYLDTSTSKYRCWFACAASAEKPERETLT